MTDIIKEKDKLSSEQQDALLEVLKDRFNKNSIRHQGLKWEDVLGKLENSPKKLWSIYQMEITGGEPDVVVIDQHRDTYVFVDCASESPTGRRNTCYDQQARTSRKKFAPESSALEMAKAMGIELLSEEQYRHLQTLGSFDTKTSSWILTPEDIRKRGGALFCDRRYETVFVYHNGADSYYASRGFRGLIIV